MNSVHVVLCIRNIPMVYMYMPIKVHTYHIIKREISKLQGTIGIYQRVVYHGNNRTYVDSTIHAYIPYNHKAHIKILKCHVMQKFRVQ